MYVHIIIIIRLLVGVSNLEKHRPIITIVGLWHVLYLYVHTYVTTLNETSQPHIIGRVQGGTYVSFSSNYPIHTYNNNLIS